MIAKALFFLMCVGLALVLATLLTVLLLEALGV